MKILVIGCGSIGQRHIANLRELGVKDITVVDLNKDREKEVREKFGVSGCPSTISSKLHYDACLICTPPMNRLAPIKLGTYLSDYIFIEKPLASNLEDARVIVKTGKVKNVPIQMGYQMRFGLLGKVKRLLEEEAIGKVQSVKAGFGYYLPFWHPNEDYRQMYTARKECGLILDASHEIDYLRWLFGEVRQVYSEVDKMSELEIECEDWAEITMWHDYKTVAIGLPAPPRTPRISGIVSHLHLDLMQREYSRYCNITGSEGTIRWECNKGVWLNDKMVWKDEGDMYLEEMRHFLHCIRAKEKPLVDGETGLRVLEIALVARNSNRRIMPT